uniref:Zinc finger CCCH domain-containing protein 14 n=1 Tax=Rhabditophanes sp. KR3021 TaxID=114890 RepID=A0AC35U2H8_9BILA
MDTAVLRNLIDTKLQEYDNYDSSLLNYIVKLASTKNFNPQATTQTLEGFLGSFTESFVSWLVDVLEKGNASKSIAVKETSVPKESIVSKKICLPNGTPDNKECTGESSMIVERTAPDGTKKNVKIIKKIVKRIVKRKVPIGEKNASKSDGGESISEPALKTVKLDGPSCNNTPDKYATNAADTRANATPDNHANLSEDSCNYIGSDDANSQPLSDSIVNKMTEFKKSIQASPIEVPVNIDSTNNQMKIIINDEESRPKRQKIVFDLEPVKVQEQKNNNKQNETNKKSTGGEVKVPLKSDVAMQKKKEIVPEQKTVVVAKVKVPIQSPNRVVNDGAARLAKQALATLMQSDEEKKAKRQPIVFDIKDGRNKRKAKETVEEPQSKKTYRLKPPIAPLNEVKVEEKKAKESTKHAVETTSAFVTKINLNENSPPSSEDEDDVDIDAVINTFNSSKAPKPEVKLQSPPKIDNKSLQYAYENKPIYQFADQPKNVYKSSAQQMNPLTKMKSSKCVFWPKCKKVDCPFIHPTTPCAKFPNCYFGNKCLYIHPTCKFQQHCNNSQCPFTHIPSGDVPAQTAAFQQAGESNACIQLSADPDQQQPVQTNNGTSMACNFGGNCKNILKCPFRHPKACRFGANCQNRYCSFTHTTSPSKPVSSENEQEQPSVAAVVNAETIATQ